MLDFFSASVRMVNSRGAVSECLESALGSDLASCDLVMLNASMGHDLQVLVDEARRLAPRARVVASSCGGVVGREGVSESMKDLAVMAVRGPELVTAHVDGVSGHTAFARGRALGQALLTANPAVTMAYLLGPGIDTANDQLLAGLESALGPEVTLFGATSSDNMRALVSHQAHGGQVFEHAAFAVGLADPSLEVDTQATHGFLAVGEPLTVTRAEGNRVLELNGRGAWAEYAGRLGLGPDTSPADALPIGALAELLPPELAEEYGNPHLLRAVTGRDAGGALSYTTTCAEGTQLWLTVRDEDRIFGDLDRMLRAMQRRARGRKPVAVFHADCLARGRFLFNRVMKEELVGRMQFPFSTDGQPPPWLGMYGFGEFARLGGRNTYHNYTTSLAALYRR